MNDRPAPSLAESIAAAQAWWREAGVEHDYSDEPRPWLADPAGEAPSGAPEAAALVREAPAAPPPPAIGGDRAAWPQDLAAYNEWWLNEPSLDTGGNGPRVPPRGLRGAPVMLLVPMPEAEDRDTLLAGAEGRLLASLVAAMGLAPDGAYLAAALPRHAALPDWNALAARSLGEVLHHHISLAAPERVIVLGRSILPLLGHDPAQGAPLPEEIAIQGSALPLLVSLAPGRLLESAGQRAALWRRWLDWTDGDGE